MTQNPNELGALWVNDPKNDRSPVLTGTVNGQRVSVFKNKRWSQEEKKKQPVNPAVAYAGKAEFKRGVGG